MYGLMKWWVVSGMLLSILAGCGGGGGDRDRPPLIGLVGIDDRPTVAITAPELTVEYSLPGVPVIFVVSLLSDQPRDGDIAFDPVQGTFTLTHGPDTLLFGIDSASPNRPEYRAFLDFPLDGSTGGAVIPLNASILSAHLTIFVNFVDFSATVPVLLDLVEYSVVSGLTPADYSTAPLAVRAFNIFGSDVGRDVLIDVTQLMAATQSRGLADFQVRLLLGP
ncbi:MAG: hypothetical protein IH614_06165 [Desulfuromonadales bacterium]|nr:hypothetical protein [Desulfuromonadales bacterium]